MPATRPWRLPLVASVAVLLVVFVAASVIAASGLSSAGRLVTHANDVRQTTEHLVNLLADAEASQRGFIITNDERYLDTYHHALDELPGVLEQEAALTADDPTQRQRVDEVQRLAAVKLAELKETLDARRASGFGAAQALVLTHRGKRTMDAIREHTGAILADEGRVLRQRTVAQARRRLVAAVSAIGSAALLSALLVLLWRLGRAASQIEGERQRLQAVLNRLPFGLMLFDCSSAGSPQCLLANDHAREIARLDHLSPIEAAKQTPLERTLSHGEEIRGAETWLTHADGTRALVRMNSIVLREPPGACLAIAAFDDITKEAETARFAEQFIGILSHDLRTPLSAIVMGAQMLLRQGGFSGAQMKNIQRILTSAERIARMVSHLLDLTRIRLGGGIPFEPRSTDLSQLVRDAVQELEIVHPDRRIVSAVEPALICACDPDRIAQVVTNLISNAIQHGKPDTPVEVSAKSDGALAVVRVHNQGEPIPPEMLAVVFDPFRGGKTGTTGLGLGLYVASQIVRTHGGTIEVSSTEKDGTCFTVRLPRQPTS